MLVSTRPFIVASSDLYQKQDLSSRACRPLAFQVLDRPTQSIVIPSGCDEHPARNLHFSSMFFHHRRELLKTNISRREASALHLLGHGFLP
jgi:hypothetical protein